MKIINVIGYSGSGKTTFISNVIKLLKSNLNLSVAAIKNIHEHQIDEPGKDTFKFAQAGAQYSITKNINNETTIFLTKEISLEQLKDWLIKGPFKIDLIITEGFRDLEYPTVLCLKDFEELHPQLTDNVKMITGVILSNKKHEIKGLDLPIIEIQENIKKFLEIFNIE